MGEEVRVTRPQLLAVTMPQRWVKLHLALDALSKTYGISTERVRQIEERALEKLKQMATN